MIEKLGEGARFFTGLTDQNRTRGFLRVYAKFNRGGVRACLAVTPVLPRTRKQAPLGEEPAVLLSKIGRDDRIRTCDPLTPSQVRYQAAPHPETYLRL